MKRYNYALVVMLAFSLFAFDANSETYTVNDLSGNHSGIGTLAWAINEANTNTPNQRDTIDFDVGLSGTINLTITLPSLDDPQGVFINGCGSGDGSHSITLNGSTGAIHLASDNNEICGLVIINFSVGILVEGNDNMIYDNYIGIMADGISDAGNITGINIGVGYHGNIIGGDVGNVISGNGMGIQEMGGFETIIRHNFIGTDADGNSAVPNMTGIEMWGYGSTIDSNVVSGNTGVGIGLSKDNAVITGNKIGTNFDGTGDIGNQFGIFVYYSGGHWIGNSDPGLGNIISFNDEAGITGFNVSSLNIMNNIFEGNGISASTGGGIIANAGCQDWQITGNEIFSNYKGVVVLDDATEIFISLNSIYENTGLGIDLGGDGVTSNDPGDSDTGPNGLLNYPEFSGVGLQGTACANCYVELYQTEEPDDASNHGEGYDYIHTALADAGGNFEFSCYAIPPNAHLTALARDVNGNTSEFSENVWIELKEITVLKSNEPNNATLQDAIIDGNAHYGPVEITFWPGVGTSTDPIQPSTPLPPLTNPFGFTIDGCLAPGGTNSVILDGQNLSGTGHGLTLAEDNNVICGLVIINFPEAGIYIQAGSFNQVRDNYLGVDYDGTTDAGNGYGVYVLGSSLHITNNNIIHFNVVSGNNYSGIYLNTAYTEYIQSNLIGTDYSGLSRLPNDQYGIHMVADTGSQISNNTISGNDRDGIWSTQSYKAKITGNNIGTDINRSSGLYNGSDGIHITSSDSIYIANNFISGNLDNGIFMDECDSLKIVNNIIGTDGLVSYDIPNGDDMAEAGIAMQDCHFVDTYGTPASLDCGPSPSGSIISGNFGAGISLESCSTVTVINTNLGYNCYHTIEIPNRDGIVISNSKKIDLGSLEPDQGNIITSDYKGIDLSNSYVVSIKRNRVHSSDTGIYIHDGSHHCQVIENRISENRVNLVLKGSTTTNNLLARNMIHHCVDGPDIDLWPTGITDAGGWDPDSPNNAVDYPDVFVDITADLVQCAAPLGEVYIYKARDYSARINGVFGSPITDSHGGAISYLGKTPCDGSSFCDDIYGLSVDFKDIITGLFVDPDNNTSEFGHNVLAVPWWAGGKCPILLEVEDPLGRVINSDSSQIPLAEYDTTDFSGDGEPDQNVNLSCQVVGEYKIRVFPKTDAQPGETYSLYIDGNYGDTMAVVQNAAVPEQGSYHEYYYEVDLSMPCDCEPGNCNSDQAINILDITYMINYLYKDGPLPIPYELCSADPGGNCSANILDITYLISFLYKGGPAPVDCESWLTSCGGPLRE